jgi:hypothetical protein
MKISVVTFGGKLTVTAPTAVVSCLHALLMEILNFRQRSVKIKTKFFLIQVHGLLEICQQISW